MWGKKQLLKSECKPTFYILMDNSLWVKELKSFEDMLRHRNDLKFSHRPTAFHLLQDRAPFSSLHEEVDCLIPQNGPIQFCNILMAEAGLDFNIGRFELFHWDLGCQNTENPSDETWAKSCFETWTWWISHPEHQRLVMHSLKRNYKKARINGAWKG